MFGLEKQDLNVTQNRNLYVGGSDVPTILGINKYKSQFELAKEKLGIIEREFHGNEYTAYGNQLEPQIRDYINAVNQMNFIVNTFIDEEKSIRSNVDGIDLDHKILLEIKTHGKKPDLKVYRAQMQLYMAQTGCQVGWLAMYNRPENFDTEFDVERLQIIEVERNEEEIKQILDAIETFWVRCEYLRDQHDMSETEFMTKGTDVDKTLMKLNRVAPDIVAFKKQLKEMEAIEADLKKELYDKMTEYDIKQLDTPLMKVTRVLPTVSKGFDKKGLQIKYPDIYEEFETETKKSGYVKITEKKGKE